MRLESEPAMSSLLAQFLLPALVAGIFAAVAATFAIKVWLRGERKLLQEELAARFDQWQQQITRELANLPVARAAGSSRSIRPAASMRLAASARPSAAPAQLRVSAIPQQQQSGAYLFAGDPDSALRRQFIPIGAKMRIGRSAQCDIVFEAASAMSKVHALIELSDGEVWLADLGSRNGTFINGQRIRARAPVPDLATLSFGGVEARLVRI